ncbi:MAG: DUF4011 domain-containing protein [Planctomycetota bacterium]
MSPDFSVKIVEWQNQLLDTTKRNRLIKFSTGRGGGVNIVHPDCHDLWKLLVGESKTLTFRWKRDILEVPAAAIDGIDRRKSDASAEPDNGAIPLPDPQRQAASAPEAAGAKHDKEQQAPARIVNHTERCLSSRHLIPKDLVRPYGQSPGVQPVTPPSHGSRIRTEHGVSTLYVVSGFLQW